MINNKNDRIMFHISYFLLRKRTLLKSNIKKTNNIISNGTNLLMVQESL